MATQPIPRTKCSFSTAALIFATLAPSSQAAPPNDNFADSIQITGTNFTVIGDFTGATLEPDETPPLDGGMVGSLTIWYSWAAPATGRAYFIAQPFAVSRWLWVYVGTDLTNLRRVPVVEYYSNRSFLATEGTVYHLQIGGVSANGDTSVTLTMELRPEVPCDNDDFSNAALLKGQSLNIWYTGAAMPPLHWTLGATTEVGEPAHRLDGPANSLWWKWVAPVHGRLVPETRGSIATNIVMAMYQGASLQALTLLGRLTNSSGPSVSVTAGETYYIAAAVTNEVGDVFLGGFVNGNTSFTPVPGNLLLNPSFEQGVFFDFWSVSGNYGGYMSSSGADGRSWPSLSTGTRIWQDIPTVPGHQYRIRFIWRFGGSNTSGPGERLCRVIWDTNDGGTDVILASDIRLWQCPTFIVTASNTTSRFTLVNEGPPAEFDGCSIVDITAPPAIVTQPRSVSTLAGGTASFVIGATGSQPLHHQWFFDGIPLLRGTNRLLVIEAASTSDVGAYHATVSNAFGAVTSSVALLNVESSTYPVIVWQPYSQTVAAGGYLSLSAVAAGTAPMSYEWYLNDQVVPGATNRQLTFDPVQPTDAGTYKLRVANNAGSVWSLPATLTVTAAHEGGALIYFSNKKAPSGASNDAPVLDIDSFTRLNGSNYVAQLYAGAKIEELRPTGTPSPFYGGFAAGFFVPKTVTLPTIAPGSNVLVQVRAWELSKGTSYEEARALGGKYGSSEIFNVATYPAETPPAGLRGLQSFALKAGLPFFSVGVIRLSHREPRGVVVWSLEGEPGSRYVIEKAVRDFVWQPYLVLTNITGTATFTDSANSGAATVFFRARILD